jgi:hypothetical protein
MMYWILLVMGAIVSLVTAVLLGGAMIPRAYRATRIMTVGGDGHRDAATIWRALDRIGEWPLWTEQARTVSIADAASPSPLRLRVHGDDGAVRAEIVLSVTPGAAGVEVRATEEGAIANPALRLWRHYVAGHAELVTALLRALGEQIGEAAPIREA